MAAGADRLDVADHLMLGAERGDEQAVGWLRTPPARRRGRRRRSPSSFSAAPRRCSRAVIATRTSCRRRSCRRCCVPGAWPRRRPAEAVLARHAAEVDTPMRLALVGALALQNRADELIDVVEASLAAPDRLRPADQLMLAQQSWALTYTGAPGQASRPLPGRSPSPNRRATRRCRCGR